jgi:glycosyltransferase involved in cell wall biosynthesis
LNYSIIIPIYNESKKLELLLNRLEPYYEEGHEILIINDGSTDGSEKVLESFFFIKVLTLKNNLGKGNAITAGLFNSKYNKIIIYDGDLELGTKDISKLMILNKSSNIYSTMGIRFKQLSPFKSGIDWGNFIFTVFFNFLNGTCHKDILCCAKSFYKSDIQIKKLKSVGFDIDIELASALSKNNRGRKIQQILIDYNRRSIDEGKKLRTNDGWIILKRILLTL